MECNTTFGTKTGMNVCLCAFYHVASGPRTTNEQKFTKNVQLNERARRESKLNSLKFLAFAVPEKRIRTNQIN